jgi:hypothetical protein
VPGRSRPPHGAVGPRAAGPRAAPAQPVPLCCDSVPPAPLSLHPTTCAARRSSAWSADTAESEKAACTGAGHTSACGGTASGSTTPQLRSSTAASDTRQRTSCVIRVKVLLKARCWATVSSSGLGPPAPAPCCPCRPCRPCCPCCPWRGRGRKATAAHTWAKCTAAMGSFMLSGAVSGRSRSAPGAVPCGSFGSRASATRPVSHCTHFHTSALAWRATSALALLMAATTRAKRRGEWARTRAVGAWRRAENSPPPDKRLSAYCFCSFFLALPAGSTSAENWTTICSSWCSILRWAASPASAATVDHRRSAPIRRGTKELPASRSTASTMDCRLAAAMLTPAVAFAVSPSPMKKYNRRTTLTSSFESCAEHGSHTTLPPRISTRVRAHY